MNYIWEMVVIIYEKTSGREGFDALRQNCGALMAESSKACFLCFIHQRPTPPLAAISLPEEKSLPAAGKEPASQEKKRSVDEFNYKST